MIHLNRPFRFQSFWLSDPSFPTVVSHAWKNSGKLSENIENFVKETSSWNKHHFRNIFEKKKKIKARLNGIQRALAINPSPSLIHLESQLLKDLNVMCGQETELWALKARINWLVLGDRNTSFYHILALTRRKQNLITSVKNGASDWIMEEREVMNFFREGFYKLYTTAQESASGNSLHLVLGMGVNFITSPR